MKNLRKIREQRNINQLKVAKDLDITQESISKYETNRAMPSSNVLIKLADYFNCSVDYLLDRTENPKMNTENVSSKSEEIENLVFRFNKLSIENKNKLDGFLSALEQNNNPK